MSICDSRALSPYILPLGLLIGNQLFAFSRLKPALFYYLLAALSVPEPRHLVQNVSEQSGLG